MVDKQEYHGLKKLLDAYEQARQVYDPKRYERGGGYDQDECNKFKRSAGIPVNTTTDKMNQWRAKVEYYEFVDKPPVRYFSYINETHHTMGCWTGGIVLGSVSFGRAWKDNFGGTRVPITVQGINGCTYYGTYYKSAGDYCRIKMSVKDQHQIRQMVMFRG